MELHALEELTSRKFNYYGDSSVLKPKNYTHCKSYKKLNKLIFFLILKISLTRFFTKDETVWMLMIIAEIENTKLYL